jgi:hypothetical protein
MLLKLKICPIHSFSFKIAKSFSNEIFELDEEDTLYLILKKDYTIYS